MKKIALLFMALAGTLSAQAKAHFLIGNEENIYAYLTIEMTDGARVSLSTSSLTLTISGNTMTAGSQLFTLSNLSKMYFSTTDETTSIGEISIAAIDDACDIYDLQGHKVSKEQMQKGVYIIKEKDRTYKMVVK